MAEFYRWQSTWPCHLRVADRGLGWQVEADWHGERRPIFRPGNGPGLELLDVRDCLAYVSSARRQCACGAGCTDGICTAQELGEI